MLYKETSVEDMVGISTIEVLEPDLYKWICNNKEIVCGSSWKRGISSGNNKTDYRKLYSEEFLRIGIDPERSIKCVATLFPAFANDVNEHHVGFQNSSEVRGKMRAAHEGRFELYFMFDFDDIKVPRVIVNDCIQNMDNDSLQVTLEQINNQGNIIFFLEELMALMDQIPPERLGLLTTTIINMQGKFLGENKRAFFALHASSFADYCVWGLLKKIKSEDERYDVISAIAEAATKTGLGALARIINRIELGYGRLAGDVENKEEQIIRLDQLRNLEQLYVTAIQRIATEEDLLDLNDFSYIIYLWEALDQENAPKYIQGLMQDENQTLKYVCAMANRWNGTGGNGWSFNAEQYSSYISDDEIYNLIQKYDKKRLHVFSDNEQIKLASFFLNYQKDEMYHANEQKAMKLVQEWKQEEV